MNVKDYMFTDISTVKPEDNLDSAVRLMVEKKTNSLIVVDANNKPVGMLSSLGIIRETVPEYLKADPVMSQFDTEAVFCEYAKKLGSKKVSDAMYADIHVLTDDDVMIEAASYTAKSNRRIMPVVNKDTGELVGMITPSSIRNAVFDAMMKNGGEVAV